VLLPELLPEERMALFTEDRLLEELEPPPPETLRELLEEPELR
jgi:hypothetical protein